MRIHEYYPTRRSAYGPRGHRPHSYADACCCISARELAEIHPHAAEWHPMPNGGHRVYARCASCGRRCEKLYRVSQCYALWECRQCAGLIYWSQYEGRRIEASKERIFHYLRAGGGVVRTLDAFAIWLAREVQHDARCWMSMAITDIRWQRFLAKVQAMEHVELTKEDRAQIIDLQTHWRAIRRKNNRTAPKIGQNWTEAATKRAIVSPKVREMARLRWRIVAELNQHESWREARSKRDMARLQSHTA